MAGLPVMSGAVKDTLSVMLPELFVAVTVGASSLTGGSATSVTLMVTAMVSSTTVSALPLASFRSLTLRVTL